jgi:tetratricopeptide (TPR) repeat protein
MAQETVKLEYKLKPGTELIYKLSGTVKMNLPDGNQEVTLSGLPRLVIADVDATTGVMLVGQLPATKIEINKTQVQTFDNASVCRMDRAGNPVARKMKDEGKLQGGMAMMLLMFDNRQLAAVSLPTAAVAVGATWESASDSALAGLPIPTPCKVVSTLAEIKTVEGHKCAVIKSKLTPSEKKLSASMPDITASGEVETLFDVDGGFSHNLKCKMDLTVNEGGQNVTASVESTSVLDSMKSLPPEEAARERKVIRALDAAVAAVYDGEYDKATDALESLKPAETPEAWKAGINKTIGTVKNFAQMAKGGSMAMQAQPADPAQELFAEAEKARQDQKWADAVAKYKELAEKYPDNSLAATALITAARITETNLNDKKSADELRQRAVALQEKRAAGDPMELFKLAGVCANSGDLEKAVATYRKFVAAADPKIPANMRLLAQFRIGGLLEKQGKTADAAEAYKAMAAMPADDDYSTKLKEQAKKRIEALAAANR